MAHYLITYDTNGFQSEFATTLAEKGWDDHYTNASGEERRLPNTTFVSQKYNDQASAVASVAAARDKIKADHGQRFAVTHFAIGQYLSSQGGELRDKQTKSAPTKK
ncbi:hypothetical protein AB4099_12490 [Bosea sp. 2KB_26]|uniref:hypothetical protein n=1 Tax=Bosea sp. 2KB_26 TaxID=3237475 RepID=UPI003F9274DD